jgi:hypothetical protein
MIGLDPDSALGGSLFFRLHPSPLHIKLPASSLACAALFDLHQGPLPFGQIGPRD